MGLLEYSTGKWILEKNKLQLLGFTDDDLKTINVESGIDENRNSDRAQILIHYSTDATTNNFIKTGIVINESIIYFITKDTPVVPNFKTNTIQIKSYLSYTGLLSSNPKIDTLYSKKIKVDNANQAKTIKLQFTVQSGDFSRTKLTDTITVKNNHTLLYHKIKLRKYTQ